MSLLNRARIRMENDFYETLTFIIDKDGPESVTNMIENISCHPKKLTGILNITMLFSVELLETSKLSMYLGLS